MDRKYKPLEKFLKDKHPTVLDQYQQLTTNVPRETDLSRLRQFAFRFSDITGKPVARHKVKDGNSENRSVFIGMVILIYKPSIFNGYARLDFGVVQRLATILNVRHSYINQLVEYSIFANKHLPEFRAKINSLAEQVLQ